MKTNKPPKPKREPLTTYTHIPDELSYLIPDPHLRVFCKIAGLTKRDGYCSAGNNYLAEHLGDKSISAVQKSIRLLERDGCLKRETFCGRRRLYIAEEYKIYFKNLSGEDEAEVSD